MGPRGRTTPKKERKKERKKGKEKERKKEREKEREREREREREKEKRKKGKEKGKEREREKERERKMSNFCNQNSKRKQTVKIENFDFTECLLTQTTSLTTTIRRTTQR